MYFFIVNPHSCRGKGERVWAKLETALKNSGAEYTSCLTQKTGDAREFARKLTEGCKEPRVIVVVGGDGTFNEVLDGLALYGLLSLGYVSVSLGNDFARSLKLPQNPIQGLNRIFSPRGMRLLDYGVLTFGSKAEHRRFAISAGLGIVGDVSREVLAIPVKKKKVRLGLEKMIYAISVVKQLLLAKPVRGYIILDRAKRIEFHHIYFISANIHPFEGGGFRLAPMADGSDGRLSVCVVSHGSKWRLIPIFFSALFSWAKERKGIRTYECREAFIHVERPMSVHTDGEDCGSWEDLQAACIERQLRLLV